MLECKICGCKFNAIEERHYISRDNGKTGLAVAFGSTNEETLYDSFDCPMCGWPGSGQRTETHLYSERILCRGGNGR